MYDAEPPDVYTAKWRKAAKDHVCCECRGTIHRGEKYFYLTGIWDGYGATYKTCQTCEHLRKDVEAELSLFGTEAVPYGYLYQAVADADLEVEDGILLGGT